MASNLYVDNILVRTGTSGLSLGATRRPVRNDNNSGLVVQPTDYYITCQCDSGVSITMVSGLGMQGQAFMFKNKGSGLATITPQGTDKFFDYTIQDNFVLAKGDTLRVIWSGNWDVLF